MKLEKKNLIVERPYKSVYKTEEGIVKIFATDHPKSAVFNEALNTVKVEETGLDIPKLKEVTQINGEWVQSKTATTLPKLKDKLADEIRSLKDLDATERYELLTRLEGMPKHTKLCHGDFNPSNVIVEKNGKMTVIDWAHASQGNASADAAMTYLLFALHDQESADLYLKLFCKKSDTARQYVEQWLPIVAAAELGKDIRLEKDFLMKWIDVMEYE